MNALESALYYKHKKGFSVIPQAKNKRPLVSWKKYQMETADDDEIKQWFTKDFPDAQVGIVTGDISNLAIIDIDTKEGMRIVQKFLPKSFACPTVITPSGGTHLYCQYNIDLISRSRQLPGVDIKAGGGVVMAPPSRREDGKGYKWVKDKSIRNTKIPPFPDPLLKEIVQVQERRNETTGEMFAPEFSVSFKKGKRDQTLFHIGNHLVRSGMARENVMQVLYRLARTCSPPETKQKAREKVKSAVQRAMAHDRNLTEEVRKYIDTTAGRWFQGNHVANDLNLTPKERKHLYVVLNRLVESEEIEKHPLQNGKYRKLDRSMTILKWWACNDTPLDILFPLGVEKLVNVMPGNSLVLAGVGNAGKSAYMLAFAMMNMDKYKINYFTSEFSDAEIKKRLKLAEKAGVVDLEKFKERVTVIEMTENYLNCLDPDGINIIDYVEINRDFFTIGEIFKDIDLKLNKGIAFISEQKDPKQIYGYGGDKGTQKCRLYMTMDRGLLRIHKGKDWASKTQPTYQSIKFKLINGITFLDISGWHYNPPDYSKRKIDEGVDSYESRDLFEDGEAELEFDSDL